MSPDALAGLRDYHLPASAHWWPPAPGWWLLAAVAALVAFLLWRRRRRRPRRLQAPQLALAELAQLRARWEADGDDAAFVRELAQLMRRYAIARWPADAVAGLTGAAWRAYLLRQCEAAPPAVRASLSAALGEALTRWPYQPQPGGSPPALAAALAELIRHAGGDDAGGPRR
ncbi:DUF4381 domain-containing protein [uncultured Thiohalocapsa sp.]|uniref:DUF4381 domain-containing protein n=1 Tax=uncultured Thiohalocapsa sp. TaxID=768990 RepID=UPI0025E02AF1|nr:DUF4381 domain-containing protein [uncultured Thiohalocapsa sp.]